MSKPKVCIIILNWNGFSNTLDCLQSLGGISYPNYEVIVVDNGSKNQEGKKIKQRYREIHLILNKSNLGFAEGNNVGIRYALRRGTDYILLLNNDTVVYPNFLDILIEYGEKHQKVGILGPKILYFASNKIWFNGVRLYSWLGLFRHRDKSRTLYPFLTDYVSGSAFLVKREVIEKIGLFYSPFFTYYEEADFCFRARKKGYYCVVAPQSIIRHKVDTSSGKRRKNVLTASQAYYFPRNALLFAGRNLSGFKRCIFMIAQYTFALIYNILRCQDSKARLIYIKSLTEATFLPKFKVGY